MNLDDLPEDCTVTPRARSAEEIALLEALQAAEANIDAQLHGRRPPMNDIKLAQMIRAAIAKATAPY